MHRIWSNNQISIPLLFCLANSEHRKTELNILLNIICLSIMQTWFEYIRHFWYRTKTKFPFFLYTSKWINSFISIGGTFFYDPVLSYFFFTVATFMWAVYQCRRSSIFSKHFLFQFSSIISLFPFKKKTKLMIPMVLSMVKINLKHQNVLFIFFLFFPLSLNLPSSLQIRYFIKTEKIYQMTEKIWDQS